MSAPSAPAITIPRDHIILEIRSSTSSPAVLHRDKAKWYVTHKQGSEPQMTDVFTDQQSARYRFCCPIERFSAYELRVFSVTTGGSPSSRFLVGVLKSAVELVRQQPDLAGAKEDEVIEVAFNRAWEGELRAAFLELFGSSGIIESPEREVKIHLLGEWKKPVIFTLSCCVWVPSDIIVIE
jgi:hypothetical protein